jgi:acid stress-induced BolA-like protein IbaG/YrbA
MTGTDIEEIIKTQMPCESISITGDGRHWFGVIVSSSFEGLRALQRHQKVYACLGNKMHNDEIHALSMKTFTPAEWALQDATQFQGLQ